jgi:uncharacterized OB-fold protein
MSPKLSTSPRATFVEYCRRGELAYQVPVGGGDPVFYPRLVAPGHGGQALEWRTSAGMGTVHATTTLSRKGDAPYNVALIDLDEGFRMMSRVDGIPPQDVVIGMRVRVAFVPGDGDQPPYPVFHPVNLGTES